MSYKALNAAKVQKVEASGLELACSLVLSELLAELVKQTDLTHEHVRHILWSAGMRLSSIRSDIDEMQLTADAGKIEHNGQHLLNLIEADVESELRRFSAR